MLLSRGPKICATQAKSLEVRRYDVTNLADEQGETRLLIISLWSWTASHWHMIHTTNLYNMDSSRSSTVAGDVPASTLPAVPKDEAFNDDSKVPFLTPWTIMMTVLVSMGGW